jgi:hypothetical protein
LLHALHPSRSVVPTLIPLVSYTEGNIIGPRMKKEATLTTASSEQDQLAPSNSGASQARQREGTCANTHCAAHVVTFSTAHGKYFLAPRGMVLDCESAAVGCRLNSIRTAIVEHLTWETR